MPATLIKFPPPADITDLGERLEEWFSMSAECTRRDDTRKDLKRLARSVKKVPLPLMRAYMSLVENTDAYVVGEYEHELLEGIGSHEYFANASEFIEQVLNKFAREEAA